MAERIIRDRVIDIPKKNFFQTIVAFDRYPKYMPEVVSASVEPGGDEKHKRVRFELEVIKRFQYTLEFTIVPEETVEWRLLESNFFKQNEGAWKLKDVGQGKTAVHYELGIAFGFFVPSMITKKLTEVNLPRMFESFEAAARGMK